MLRRLKKRAQTTAEYAILIAIVIGAIVAMQVYVRRGLEGRVRDVVDHTGQGGDVGGSNFAFTGNQYEPYYLTSDFASSRDTTETEGITTGGGVSRNLTNDRSTRTGTQTYEAPTTGGTVPNQP